MKLRVFILLLVVGAHLIALDAMGEQRRRSRRMRAGGTKVPLYAGFAFPTPVVEGDNLRISGRTGIAGGFGGAINVHEGIELGVDILYVDKSFDVSDNGIMSRYRVGFVEIPLQVRIYPLDRIYIHMGPYYALAVSADRQTQGAEAPALGDVQNDFGLTIGAFAGFESKGKMTIGLNIRYSVGLADIQNDHDPQDGVFSRSLLALVTILLTY